MEKELSNKEAEMVTLCRESIMCQGSGVICLFIHLLYLFIQQICIEYQLCVCTMHKDFKVNNYGPYMESFSYFRLNYALVTTPKSQWLMTVKVYLLTFLFVYFWLHWVFFPALGLFLAVVSEG